MSDWKRQGEHIEVPTYSIVKTRKREGRWEYKEVESGQGDWNDLVFILWENFEQFRDLIIGYSSVKELHEKLDSVAANLEKKGVPYEFTLADKTDDWYYAFCKPAVYRVDHDGKLG
jgi:hypothetical protein